MHTLGSLQTLTYSIHMERRPIRSIGNINAKDYVMGPRTIAGTLIFAVFNKHFAYEIMDDIKKKYNPRYAFLADELPPFNITVTFANEYGANARLVLYGVRLVNEGQVMSVNDIYTENTYQFVATDIEYLTDTNGYSTTLIPKTEEQKAKELKAKNTSGKNIKDKMKQPNNTEKPECVKLMTQPISSQTEDKKGVVKLWLIPWKDSGVITVKGQNLSKDININMSDYKNQAIYLSLLSGEYTAVYNDTTTKAYSTQQEFLVGIINAAQTKLLPAPLIEYCTDRSISVYSNVPTHKKLKYAEIDGSNNLNYKEVILSGRRATINDLKQKTKYSLYTCDDKTESMRIYALTEEFYDRLYEDLRHFVIYNESRLRFGTLNDYCRIIDEAKHIALTAKEHISLTTAICTYRDYVQKQLISLKPGDFKTNDEYNAAVKSICNEITMCFYLLQPSNMLENDNVIAVNPPTVTVVKPPVPEITDAINCVFTFGPDIERLEFYRQYSNIAQFAIEAKKIGFYNYLDGKKGFKFDGKPGVNHYVYAFNKYGERSPKLQFYVMTDEEKSKELDLYYSESKDVQKLLTDKERELLDTLNSLSLSKTNRKRVLVQECKTPALNILPAPNITNITNDKVTIDVNYRENTEQYSTDFYISIASVNDALYKRAVYKKKIESTTVEFTTSYGGIKPDMQYAIWVENKAGDQISQCATFSTYSNKTEDILDEEDRIDSYYNEKMLQQIKYNLSNKIQITNEISSCFNNLIDDLTLSWKNVFDKIAQNIMSYSPKIHNIDTIINSLYESETDIMHYVDTAFFTKVTFNPLTYDLVFSKKPIDYMVTVKYINSSGIVTKTYKNLANQDNTITLDRTSSYIVVYAVAPDIYTKSGTIIIDSVTDKLYSYKINIGG
jgi:hypothetical protein